MSRGRARFAKPIPAAGHQIDQARRILELFLQRRKSRVTGSHLANLAVSNFAVGTWQRQIATGVVVEIVGVEGDDDQIAGLQARMNLPLENSVLLDGSRSAQGEVADVVSGKVLLH